MALPKKGIRKIEYEGHKYGWLIRSKPTYTQGAFQSPMTIGIQELDCEMPKVLYVTLNIDRPDNWLSSHQTQITPNIIRNIIKGAIEEGWVFNEGGAAYEYEFGVIKNA